MINAKFAKIIQLEEHVKSGKLQQVFGQFEWNRASGATKVAKYQPLLFAAVSALTPAEMIEFGKYRMENS
jgi:hypothetical protein